MSYGPRQGEIMRRGASLADRILRGAKKWLRNFAQGDKWNFCLTAGTLVPANQERP